MRLFILVLTSGILSACVGLNKTAPNMAIYDFGLPNVSESNQLITSRIPLEEITSAEGLNHNKIRYRLNYQNPARVFFYSESRWASTPSELLTGKLSALSSAASQPANCSLKLKIEAFDHVFQSGDISEGIVQLNVTLIEKISKRAIASELITESTAATSPNAQGGTSAVQTASKNALAKAINWGNTAAANNGVCK